MWNGGLKLVERRICRTVQWWPQDIEDIPATAFIYDTVFKDLDSVVTTMHNDHKSKMATPQQRRQTVVWYAETKSVIASDAKTINLLFWLNIEKLFFKMNDLNSDSDDTSSYQQGSYENKNERRLGK
ncbi:hypothetical protein C0J52_26338 [Blattella germanica]|nr:hypothetical protein C0J52_26338 [Blattella germanica]